MCIYIYIYIYIFIIGAGPAGGGGGAGLKIHTRLAQNILNYISIALSTLEQSNNA